MWSRRPSLTTVVVLIVSVVVLCSSCSAPTSAGRSPGEATKCLKAKGTVAVRGVLTLPKGAVITGTSGPTTTIPMPGVGTITTAGVGGSYSHNDRPLRIPEVTVLSGDGAGVMAGNRAVISYTDNSDVRGAILPGAAGQSFPYGTIFVEYGHRPFFVAWDTQPTSGQTKLIEDCLQ